MIQTPTVALPSHEWIDGGVEELDKKYIQGVETVHCVTD